MLDAVFLDDLEVERGRLNMTREEVVALVRTAADLYEVEGAATYPIELPIGALVWRLRGWIQRHREAHDGHHH